MIFLITQIYKCHVLANFSFSGRGGGEGDMGGILDYSKLKVPSSNQIFIWAGGGGGGWVVGGYGSILGQPRIGIIDKMNQKFWKPNLLLHRR